ncbi:MAG: transcriptional regulator GcvA [Candidatus Accumulibacter sp.]|jgi:LysR family glycine cleavage system transcriptional activator|nr:transcriptional regulator GcvA [Accumulibacter sp.]
MFRKLPPLNAVRAFEACARNTSFTRAADELCISQSAVSRHITCLEKWLDVKLFQRIHRGIELTPQGSTYFRIVKNALDQIESGARQLKQSPDEKRLRLKLPPTFAICWLIPRLVRFHARHPDIDVQITTSHQPVDFDREDVDVSVYSWASPPSGPGYRRLLGEVLLLVCAPALLKRGQPLRTPQDLAKHNLLCSLNRPQDWPAWLSAAAPGLNIGGNNGLKFENAALAYQAAIDELGVMVAQYAFVEDYLRSGRLIDPLAIRVPTARAYFLAYHPGRPKPPRIQAFEDWVLEEAAAVEGRFQASTPRSK